MKTIIFLLCSCVLFSSCYSYKSVNISTHEILADKKYMIATKDTKIKAKIYKLNDSTIAFVKKEVKTEIAISNIKEIKKRKFSIGKTIGMTLLTISVIGILFSNSISIGPNSPIQGSN